MPYLRSIMVDQWYKIKRRKTARSRIDVSFLATFFENSKQRDEGTYRAAFGASSYREHSVFLINRREKKIARRSSARVHLSLFSLWSGVLFVSRGSLEGSRVFLTATLTRFSVNDFEERSFLPPALLSDDHQTTIIAKSRVPSILPFFFFVLF